MYNDKQKEYTMKYLKTLKEVRFRVKPEEYERWEKAAKKADFSSLRQYYMYCINKITDEILSGSEQ